MTSPRHCSNASATPLEQRQSRPVWGGLDRGSIEGRQQLTNDEQHEAGEKASTASMRAKVSYNSEEPSVRSDRKFFRQNPTRRHRIRPALNSEILDLWGPARLTVVNKVLRPAGKEIFCAVHLVNPGFRIRRLLVGPSEVVDWTSLIGEAQARELYAIACGEGMAESDLEQLASLLTQSAGEA